VARTVRYRALRFVHPDFADAGARVGLLPAQTGALDMVEENAAVRQALLILLTTSPGERVMRPDYGCDLRKLLFSPNDDTTAGLAVHYVRQAILRWEPRVEIIKVDAVRVDASTGVVVKSSDIRASSPGELDIYLEYRVRGTGRTDTIVYPFQLTGESR
jgi:phage baseplate assembly protein W